jgi:hypothetical protein
MLNLTNNWVKKLANASKPWKVYTEIESVLIFFYRLTFFCQTRLWHKLEFRKQNQLMIDTWTHVFLKKLFGSNKQRVQAKLLCETHDCLIQQFFWQITLEKDSEEKWKRKKKLTLLKQRAESPSLSWNDPIFC